MAQEWAKAFYNSIAWQRCRDAYYLSQHGLCERCQGAGVIVHHKERLTPVNITDPTVTLDWGKLQLLCIECHNQVHGNASTADGLAFDDDGNLIQR